MYEKILQDVIAYMENLLDDNTIQVTPESNLMDDLSLSSLEMLHSLIHLEDEFGIVIPEKCLRKMITIKDVALVLTEIAERKMS